VGGAGGGFMVMVADCVLNYNLGLCNGLDAEKN
jgi:hypothetical protein